MNPNQTGNGTPEKTQAEQKELATITNPQQTDNGKPERTQAEQEELARFCRLSALDAHLKIEILININLFDLPALLEYLPDVPGSFQEVYTQHQVAIHSGILNERFLHEWRFIAPDGAKWDPQAPIPHEYRATILAIILEQTLPFVPEDTSVKEWRDERQRYRAVVKGGMVFLRFLQYFNARITRTERKIIRAWKQVLQDTETGQKAWILRWAERKLHRALLVLWRVNLLETVAATTTEEVEEKLRELTPDEGQLLLQLSEATALWHLGRKAEEIAAEEPTTPTPSSWMYRISLLRQEVALFSGKLVHPLASLDRLLVDGYWNRRNM